MKVLHYKGLMYLGLILMFGFAQGINKLTISKEVKVFFRNFYHCLFQFHSESGQKQGWNSYETIIEFYSSTSAFTIQNLNISENIKLKETVGTIRRHSNCTVQLQLFCSQVTQGMAGWRREFVWFIYPSNKTACERKHKDFELEPDITLRGYPGLFFRINENFTKVDLLCLTCNEKHTWTPVGKRGLSSIPSYFNRWSFFHSNLNGVLIETNLNEDFFLILESWRLGIVIFISVTAVQE